MHECLNNRTRLAAMLCVACVLTGCQSPKAVSLSGNSAGQSSRNICRSLLSETKSSPVNSIANHAAPASTNSVPANRILMIDSSSMPVDAGKATLIIGALQRVDGVYSGDYKVRVFPYFLKNEKGTLAIVVSDESLAGINHGKVVAIIGTATTSGKAGRSRHIDATAMPVDINHGTLKLWFMAGNRKMIFEPTYHVAENGAAAVLTQPAETKP
jgi:hypothetical protein